MRVKDLKYSDIVLVFRLNNAGGLERQMRGGGWRVVATKPNQHGYSDVRVAKNFHMLHRIVFCLANKIDITNGKRGALW